MILHLLWGLRLISWDIHDFFFFFFFFHSLKSIPVNFQFHSSKQRVWACQSPAGPTNPICFSETGLENMFASFEVRFRLCWSDITPSQMSTWVKELTKTFNQIKKKKNYSSSSRWQVRWGFLELRSVAAFSQTTEVAGDLFWNLKKKQKNKTLNGSGQLVQYSRARLRVKAVNNIFPGHQMVMCHIPQHLIQTGTRLSVWGAVGFKDRNVEYRNVNIINRMWGEKEFWHYVTISTEVSLLTS